MSPQRRQRVFRRPSGGVGGLSAMSGGSSISNGGNGGSTGRMVRGATVVASAGSGDGNSSSSSSCASNIGGMGGSAFGSGGSAMAGTAEDTSPSSTSLAAFVSAQNGQQKVVQKQQMQQQRQQQQSSENGIPPPPAPTDNIQAEAEPSHELEAMVLDRVSRMVLADVQAGDTPSPSASSPTSSPSSFPSSSSSSNAIGDVGTGQPNTNIAAIDARPPVRRFRVLPAGTTSTGRHARDHAEPNRQRKAKKRVARDLMPTPVTNNQTTRPGDDDGASTTTTPPPVSVHLNTETHLGTSGLLPRLSPPLGITSPTNCSTASAKPTACAISSSTSSSPTSTTATPTVTAQMIATGTGSIGTSGSNTGSSATRQHRSADGTSLTIDGGAHGGRKRRMLKKRHRRSNASIAGPIGSLAAVGCGMSMGGGGCGNGCGTTMENIGSPPSMMVDGVGCLGGILPDLADIFDGACGGGANDVMDTSAGITANGNGGIGSPHPLSGSGPSSFPDPFGMVTKASAGRSKGPRPPSTTALGVSGSQRSFRSASSLIPHHPLARSKRPSAPTPPGAGLSQSSVFDQRLDRLAIGVKTARSRSCDGGIGTGMPAPPNLVPKFRASPLPFSANLHVTPQPRRATSGQTPHHGKASKKSTTSRRRARDGAKSTSSNAGAFGLPSRSTGLSGSAAFAAPCSSRGSTPVPPAGRGGTISAPPPTPSAPGFEPIKDGGNASTTNHRQFQQRQGTVADNGAVPAACPHMPASLMLP